MKKNNHIESALVFGFRIYVSHVLYGPIRFIYSYIYKHIRFFFSLSLLILFDWIVNVCVLSFLSDIFYSQLFKPISLLYTIYHDYRTNFVLNRNKKKVHKGTHIESIFFSKVNSKTSKMCFRNKLFRFDVVLLKSLHTSVILYGIWKVSKEFLHDWHFPFSCVLVPMPPRSREALFQLLNFLSCYSCEFMLSLSILRTNTSTHLSDVTSQKLSTFF